METYGLKSSSKKLSPENFIINKLTLTNLKKAFGSAGQYAYLPAIVFDNTSKSFYYLTKLDSRTDALSPGNWSLVSAAADINAKEWVAKNYQKGSMISKTSETLEVSFYFATAETNQLEVPGVSSKWFVIPTTFSIPQQEVKFTIDNTLPLEDEASRTFTISVASNISKAGTRLPIIQVNVLKENGFYETYQPIIQIDKTTNMRVYLKFLNNLDDFKQTSNNIVVSLM